jgi:hypothetical protein
MNISCKPITLCFVFVVLGSTLAFARSTTCAEIGCRSYEKKNGCFSCSDIKTMHHERLCALPHTE